MAAIQLDTPVQYVKGVGPVRAQQLAELGIVTVEDLLLYFPFRFDLRQQAQPIGELKGDEKSATVAGEVVAVEERRWAPRPIFQCQLQDETGWCMVKWFHGGYLRKSIREGVYLAVSGRVTTWRESLQFVNPRHQILWDPAGTDLSRDELLPVYPAGGHLTSGQIGAVIRRVLPEAGQLVVDWFDGRYLASRDLMARADAVAAMHRPEDTDHWEQARRRMAYDECFLLQLGLALLRMRAVSRPAHPLKLTEKIDERIRARFPFDLTDAQDRAAAEIAADIAHPRPMNRLLQGDVGSGKTVVALYAALQAVANRRQVAIMAPTEILATQHYNKITQYLAGSRVRTELLTGRMPAKQRRRLLDGLEEGNIDIAVGTHALISEGVKFHSLGLVVVDEQHKFGVRQRSGIRQKGYAPHYLVMTATPIPRTLTMTLFGDLDTSILDEAPPGRGRVDTRLLGLDQLDDVYATVREKLDAGQQAYFIYPVVNPTAEAELTAAEDAFRDLSAGPFSDYRVGLVHGQLPAEEKDRVMTAFRAGDIQLLVASVVVEVGVDVPTANVMAIFHAERFGLAQLHQLRGRIGRGSADATCLLVAEPRNPLAKQRMDVLVEHTNGFRIAEEDLRIRGPGEFFGTKQHGLPELRMVDLTEDIDLMRQARRDAFALIHEDPSLSEPHHQRLRSAMLRAYAGKLELLHGG